MAQSTHRGNYAEFSVIARLRQGNVSSLSTYGIILEIQRHLSSYNCICNVAFSPPNYIIHLPTLELQLAVLSRKAFTGNDYVLDMVPWCSEYACFEFPWIIRSPGLKPLGLDIDNIDKEPSAGLCLSKFAIGLSTAKLRRQQPAAASAANSISNNRQGQLWKGTQVKLKTTSESRDAQGSVDFSYLMILELKQYYENKLKAYQSCGETCREVYGIAQVFAAQFERAVNSYHEHIKANGASNSENMIAQPRTSDPDLNNLLWFISEEIFGLQMTMKSMHNTDIKAVDLSKFCDSQPTGQLTEPVIVASMLKATAESAINQIHNRQLLIATEEDLHGAYYTEIWCVFFHHRYNAAIGVPKEEAEANATYRFLKHLVNVLGYTIEDENSHFLYAIVSQINKLAISISEFQICMQNVTQMIHHAQETIKETFNLASGKEPGKQICSVAASVSDLYMLAEDYNNTVQAAYEIFQHHKETFRNTKLVTNYKSTSD